MKSIIQTNRDECFLCERNARAGFGGLDEHHVYSGPYRKLSERYGLKVYLCHDSCHLNGVHKDAELNKELKAHVQGIAMKHYGWTEDDFRKIFGKSYL